MSSNAAACKWLDLLLNNRQFKRDFQTRGGRNDNVPKMKFYINVKSLAKK